MTCPLELGDAWEDACNETLPGGILPGFALVNVVVLVDAGVDASGPPMPFESSSLIHLLGTVPSAVAPTRATCAFCLRSDLSLWFFSK